MQVKDYFDYKSEYINQQTYYKQISRIILSTFNILIMVNINYKCIDSCLLHVCIIIIKIYG